MRPLLPLHTLKEGPHCRFHGFVGHLRTPDGRLGCVYCLHNLHMPPGLDQILDQQFQVLDAAEQARRRAMAG
jgi:hypothetical protein